MAHELLGYASCALCSGWVLREVAARTGGICSDCFAGGKGPDLRRIEIMGRGFRVRVPLRKPHIRLHRQPKHPDHHAAERAKQQALKRLRAIFPDLYDTLVAEERARSGLAPWPTETAVRYGWDPDCAETIRFAAVYHALDQQGDRAR